MIRKEAVVAYLRDPTNRLARTRKTTKSSVRIAGNPENIRSGNLQNAGLETYSYNNPVG
jgi:hypothetical protein